MKVACQPTFPPVAVNKLSIVRYEQNADSNRRGAFAFEGELPPRAKCAGRFEWLPD